MSLNRSMRRGAGYGTSGARREQLIVEATSQVQQIRALLECVWPAALETAQQPFKSVTWLSAMRIILERDGGDLARTRRLGLERFEASVRREIIRSGRQKPCGRILRRLFTALADPAGVISHRPGALERVGLLLGDLRETHRRLHDAEARMLTVLDELKLTELVTSITRPVRDRRRIDPRRDRRPEPVRHREGAGQTLRPGAPRETVRQVRWPHQTHRPRQARTAPRGVASGLGRATSQPRLRRPIHSPDQA